MAPAHASSVCRSAALALKARQESGRCAEPNKPIQPWRGEMSEKAVPDTLHSPVKGLDQGKRSMVFVLDKHKKPLMPCTPKKARLLLSRGRAVVHRRYRPPRFANRRRPKGWLPPSLRSRIGNLLSWARRYGRWTPITRLEVERVKFDPHLMQNPEIAGVEYQRGELAGWELRAYLLEKFQHQCAYCHVRDVPFELDHQVPRSRGGSNRASNLVLSCHDCNVAKGNQTAAEFGHPEVEAQAKTPLKDAAAVNATRYALVRALGALSLPIGTWSGGRTRWNRDRLGIHKTHALDALCVGELAGVHAGALHTLHITASGCGQYCRTLFTRHAFPRGYLMRQKQVNGLQTGDLVLAVVPPPYKARGRHKGRVAVRKSGFFRINGVDSIPARCCTLLQRGDGYEYAVVQAVRAGSLPPQ